MKRCRVRQTTLQTSFRLKKEWKITALDFSSIAHEDYNTPFSMYEMRSALKLAKRTTPGPDEIHNLMLQHLPETAMEFLLRLFNRIWEEHTIPTMWREAIIVPVPKVGKDRSLPSSYRPISLTSCVSKVLERMVNQRLAWTLEHKNLLTPIQSGFRRNRSTLDHLVSLATAISTSFVLKQHLVAILFDIEKATCRPRRVPVPWWNADCATAVRDRKQALARLNRFPTASNLIDFKRKRARARLVIRESKTTSWRAFISSLSCHTPPKVVWRKIRQIGGRFSPSSVPGLLINGNLITSPEKVVEELPVIMKIPPVPYTTPLAS